MAKASQGRRRLGLLFLATYVLCILALFPVPSQARDSTETSSLNTAETAKSSPWDAQSEYNITAKEAYHQALDLLRTVIDPTVLSKSNDAGLNGPHSSAPAASSSHRSSSVDYDGQTSQLTKQRSTLANLSPYFTFLTSWGPVGTALRLSHRVQYTLSGYYDRLIAFLGLSRFATNSGFKTHTRNLDTSSQARGRRWPGELPAQLWPEWEQQQGRFAVHGPFRLSASRRLTEDTGNTLDISGVISKWLSNTSMGRRRFLAARKDEAAAAENLEKALALLKYAAHPAAPDRPSADALWVLSQHHILGTHGATPEPWKAVQYLESLVDDVHPGNVSARNLLGWIEGSRELWKAWGATLPNEVFAGQSQSMALLHHTFAAEKGDYASMMALAYRHHAGIGTPVDCDEALKWYTRAATVAWMRYKDGPVGGLTVPYTHLRLSDLAGGAYGPGASAASTGWESYRPAVQAALHSLASPGVPSSSGSGEPSQLHDLLEFYSYHAQGGSLTNAMRLARIYYLGSIYGVSESAGRVERDFDKVRELSLRVARQVWPMDVSNLRMVDGKRVERVAPNRSPHMADANGAPSLEPDLMLKTEQSTKLFAGAAAALLGRMYMRGEGVPVNNHKAWMWFWRGVEVGDRDCLYGYGLMRSLGLAPDQLAATKAARATKAQSTPNFDGSSGAEKLTPSSSAKTADWKGAIDAWEKAIRAGGAQGHAEASAALGKLHFDMGDVRAAARHFAHSVTWGSPFEGHFLLAMVNANTYKKSLATLTSTDGSDDMRCHAAAVHFKQAAERGDWESPLFHRGMRAWELGDKQRALVYWSMAAERGDEIAENNIAWILDRDKRKWKLPRFDGVELNSTDHVGLIYWTRSAAQGNVDAMVKMGDYYFHGIGLPESTSSQDFAWSAQTVLAVNGSEPAKVAANAAEPSYEKAMACYAAAADRQVSALAYWNMGFLYEEGLGVPRRDFHLAKRYYDMALETNREAYLPVMLSLIKLHVKALWATVWKGEESAVALFSSYGSGGSGVGGYTEAEEEILRNRGQNHGDEDAEEFGGDPNLPETYDLRRQPRLQQQQQQQQQQQPHQPREPGQPQQQYQPPLQREEAGHNGPASGNSNGGGGSGNGGNNNNGMGLMSLSDGEADAMIEGAMIVIGLSALAMLVYARQAANARAEQERREEDQRRQRALAQDPTLAQHFRHEDAQPGGPRYAGGMPWPPDAAGPQMGL